MTEEQETHLYRRYCMMCALYGGRCGGWSSPDAGAVRIGPDGLPRCTRYRCYVCDLF